MLNNLSKNTEINLEYYSSKIISIKNLNSNYLIIKIKKPPQFIYQSGQYLSIKMNDDEGYFEYNYSIASSPNINSEHIELCIQTIGNGRGVRFWRHLNIGDFIYFKEPNGSFKIVNLKYPLIFIAGGSGISPIRSFLSDSLLNKNTSILSIHLVYGCKYASSIPFKEELIEMANSFPSIFKLKFFAEEGYGEQTQNGNILNALQMNSHILTHNSHYYICGSANMVQAVCNNLYSKKINSENIFKEY